MSLPLFRSEALQARRHSWLGEVVLDQAPSARLLSLGLVLTCLAVVGLLAFGDYTRRTRVVGQLVPTQGLATVIAPVSGVVAELPVQEGQRMLQGQKLAQVVVPDATRDTSSTLDSIERSVLARRESVAAGHRAQRRRLENRAAGLERQHELASIEMAQIEAELLTRRHQQRLADQTLKKFRLMHSRRYVSDLQLQQQEHQALELLGGLQALQRQRVATEQKLAQLRQALHELPQELESAEALEAREMSALEQERLELRARGGSVVTAPISGSVGVLFVHAGQPVQAGQPLLALLPASSQLEAHLAVPGAAIGFVAPGDVVLLRYAAYPYQKFGQHRGRVLRISRNALAAAEGGGEPAYRVVVALERQSVRAGGDERALRPGLVLEADILGERRQLWEWLVEPLQTLRAQVAEREAEPDTESADANKGRGESPRSSSANAVSATTNFRAALTWRGVSISSCTDGAQVARPTSSGSPLESYPGRTGVVALPAIGGPSTRDVPCVN